MSWEKIGLKFSVSCALLFYFSANNVAQGLPANSGRQRLSKQQSGDLPTAKIFQVDQNNRIVRPWTKISENSETVLQDLDRIRLECTSDVHPVQWLYIGHGAPVLTSNVTFSRIKDRNGEIATEYVATVLISPTKEHHTGKYICSNTDHFDTRTFFYIYVPGPTLFSALNGQDILIPKNDSRILIPCTVSNPDVIVTLEKSINDVLQRVKPSLVTFDPKEGARVNIAEMDDPEGIYVCTARYNNLVRGIEYTLRYPSSKAAKEISEKLEKEPEECDIKCGDNAHCENLGGQPTCVCDRLFKGDPKVSCDHDCHSHSDCPRDTVCFRDLKCRNPCVHSIRCGANALCRVESAFPVCYCPENFVGNPKTGCVSSIQQDAPPAALNSSLPCSRKCVENSLCVNNNGKETCKCRPEAKGNPDVACDIACDSHDDCPDDLSCNVLQKCHSPCIHNIRCGVGASCAVINHRPKCYCPRDTSGDPMTECSSQYQGDQPPPSNPSDASPAPGSNDNGSNDKCKRDGECAPHHKCMKPTVERGKECVDPCITRRCGVGAECKTHDHRTFCACQDGFEGNANKECRPIKYEEGAVEPLRAPKETLSVGRNPQEQVYCSKPEKCGPFSKCTLDKDGKQQCKCLPGHTGEPPNCAEECQKNSDCPLSHVCLRDSRLVFPYCAKICNNKICGANSKCREANRVIPADCECPLGYGGDPYLHCQNLNERIGEDCIMNENCGPTLRCETAANYRKCVDPCDSLKCPDNLECLVQDHQATCACPSGYTGNPSIGCTKDVEFNTTIDEKQPCGDLSCGPHSECRIENGRPTCSCRSYALGEPPSCYQECKSSGDCEPGLSCVQKRCQHSCSSCGIYTKCLISRNPTIGSFCTCLDGFRGDPMKGCTPMNG